MQTHLETNATSRELATIFGVSPRRVLQLAQEGIIPQPDGGRFPLRASVTRYIGHLKLRSDSKTLVSARLRRTIGQARLVESEADLVERKTVLVEEVFKYNSGIFIGFKARVLASSLTPEEQHEILTDLQRLTSKDILNYAENENTTNKPAADFTAAAKPKPPNLGEQNQ